MATKDDLYHLYRLLLGRQPDEVGWRGYQQLLETTPVQRLVDLFLCSEEFRSTPAYARLLGRVDEVDLALFEADGWSMYLNPSDPLSAPLLEGPGWEPDVTAAVRARLQPDWTVIDIGANAGYFTLLSAALVGATGRVIAFEPGQDNCGLLQLSAWRNGFAQVEVFPFALTETTSLYVYERQDGTNGLIRAVDPDAPPERLGGRRQLVRGVRLDDVPLGLKRLDLVKIDVEGAELIALRGGRDTLARHLPVLVSELSPPGLAAISGATPAQYLGFLADLGYDDVAVIEPDGSATSYGLDTDAVVRAWEARARDHIDVLVSASS